MEVKNYDNKLKKLDVDVATSIICNRVLLDENVRTTLITNNRDNRYYLVQDTNTVIMHIEEDFCVLIDNKVPLCKKIITVTIILLFFDIFYRNIWTIWNIGKSK